MVLASEAVLSEAFHAARVELREAAADLEAIEKARKALEACKPADWLFPQDLGPSVQSKAVLRTKVAFERYLETEAQLAMVRP